MSIVSEGKRIYLALSVSFEEPSFHLRLVAGNSGTAEKHQIALFWSQLWRVPVDEKGRSVFANENVSDVNIRMTGHKVPFLRPAPRTQLDYSLKARFDGLGVKTKDLLSRSLDCGCPEFIDALDGKRFIWNLLGFFEFVNSPKRPSNRPPMLWL